MVRVYRSLEANEQIVIGADPGNGVSYSAAVSLSKKFHDTPLIFHARIESPQFGEELHNLGLYVKKKTGEFPLLAVERNIGQGTIEKLRELGYPLAALYRQKTFDRITQKEDERIGWVTTAQNRRKMLDSLAIAIREKELTIWDKPLISEMLRFVINERTGEPRPEQGAFSDLIMALGIAYQMYTVIPKKAHWVDPVKKRPQTFLPEKAAGFITEPYVFGQTRDWRE